ncbi:YoaP domain-containing protein [Bacillus sp. FJAT-53711]|uniref:YoaP domain-containing protein n=1 Tax=Bacillus yunxiaonensis TaxID=3127665 RepID=A0ABU8FW24_9BACI
MKEIEQKYNIPVQHHKISNREAAQTAPCAFTTYSAFYNGQFITHEIIR